MLLGDSEGLLPVPTCSSFLRWKGDHRWLKYLEMWTMMVSWHLSSQDLFLPLGADTVLKLWGPWKPSHSELLPCEFFQQLPHHSQPDVSSNPIAYALSFWCLLPLIFSQILLSSACHYQPSRKIYMLDTLLKLNETALAFHRWCLS